MLKPSIHAPGEFLAFEDVILARFTDRKTFKKGEVIAGLEESYGKYRYYVLKGNVSRSYLDLHGSFHTFGWCDRGSIFPLYYSYSSTSLERTVEFAAHQDCVVVPLPNEELDALLRENPDMSIAMMNAWCAYANYLMYRLDVSIDSVSRRVCGFLVLHMGEDRTVRATHAEIAMAMGTTRENVTRTISRLRQEGIVSSSRGLITVNDPERLRRFGSSVASIE